MSWVKEMFKKLFPVEENDALQASIAETARENSDAAGELRTAYAERSQANKHIKREISTARMRTDLIAFEKAVKREGRDYNA